MRRARIQVPQKPQILPRHRRRDIGRRVAQAHGEDLDVARRGQEARAEGQDGAAVGGGAFGEDDDGTVGVLFHEAGELDESSVAGRVEGRGGEGTQDGL